MAKKRTVVFPNRIDIAKLVIALCILGGILVNYKTSSSEASVIPPDGGGGSLDIYVNNVTGDDAKGDGTVNNPFATIPKAMAVANESAYPKVVARVAGTKTPYLLQEDLVTQRDGIELINYGKRPYVIGKSGDGHLIRIEIVGTSDTTLTGFDLLNIGLFIQASQSVLVKENRFVVQDTSLFQQDNSSSAINVASLNGDSKSNQNMIFDGNHIWVQKPTTVRMTAVRLDGTYVAQVYDNMFTPGSAQGTRALLEVVSGEDIKTAGNRFDRQYSSGAVYLMSQVKDGQVFDYTPAYE